MWDDPSTTYDTGLTLAMIKLANPEVMSVSIPPKEVTSFVNLPIEVLIKIFGYLDPYFLSRTMTLVCKRFARILNDDTLWKSVLSELVSRNTKVPVIVRHPFNMGLSENRWCSGRDVLWRDLAVQFNVLEHKWKTNKSRIIRQIFNRPHIAPIDAIKIIGGGNTVVSGGRDKLINVWKIDQENLKLEEVISAERSHDGWVWDIDSCSQETFYTCGWDNFVTYWAVSHGLNKLCTFNCGKPVMAVSCTDGLVAAGLHVPRIVLIDPRVGLVQQMGPTSLASFNLHKHAITDVLLVPEKNLLLSISEDRTLLFFDLRHHRLSYKKITISRDNSFPRCLGYYKDLIYVGDSRGNIHIYSFDVGIPEVQVINVGTQTRLVTSVVPHLGGVTVGTTDSHIRILYPSNPPVLLWDEVVIGEVTSVDQNRHLMAVSSTGSPVTLFRPTNI